MGVHAPFTAAAIGLTLAAFVFASRVTTSRLRAAEAALTPTLEAAR